MKVLIVDDEASYLELLGDLLRHEGCTVSSASDGKQAREILNQEEVDVIISDVNMPTLDGVRLHSFVREVTGERSIPFIFISGMDDSESYIVDSTVDYFVSKKDPIDGIVGLVKKLKNQLELDGQQ
jgi:DNA-binding response OmpR family regulator